MAKQTKKELAQEQARAIMDHGRKIGLPAKPRKRK